MKLNDAIVAFLNDRQAKGYAPNTVKNQGRYLRHLLAAVGNVECKNLRPQHVDAYWNRLGHLSPGTLNVARVALSTFFKWGQNRGYMRRDVELLGGMRPFKVPPRSRLIIPQSEFASIIEGTTDGRKRVMLAVGLYAFNRISETANLRWQDIDLDAGRMEVYRQKTNTIDTLPICAELAEVLRRWRFEYASLMGEPPQPNFFLIPGRQHGYRKGQKGKFGWTEQSLNPLDPTMKPYLNNIMLAELKRLGYHIKGEGGHTLRRSGAIALYDELTRVGHDRAIRVCQAMLGHANIRTTEVYLRLDLDRKVRNDLLAGKPMFPDSGSGATVVDLKQRGAREGGI
jgi:integrase